MRTSLENLLPATFQLLTVLAVKYMENTRYQREKGTNETKSIYLQSFCDLLTSMPASFKDWVLKVQEVQRERWYLLASCQLDANTHTNDLMTQNKNDAVQISSKELWKNMFHCNFITPMTN